MQDAAVVASGSLMRRTFNSFSSYKNFISLSSLYGRIMSISETRVYASNSDSLVENYFDIDLLSLLFSFLLVFKSSSVGSLRCKASSEFLRLRF